MIKCTKCGADNMIGAIFCRGCSEKLNIDDLTPDDVAKATTEKKASGSIRNLVTLVVFFVIVGVLAAIFIPPQYTEHPSMNADESTALKKRIGGFFKSSVGGTVQLNVTEVATLARVQMGLTEDEINKALEKAAEEGQNLYLVARDFDVEFLGGNSVRFILKSRFMDSVDMYTVIDTEMTAPDGVLQFETKQAYMGRLPLYLPPFIKSAETRFQRLTESNEPLKQLHDIIGNATVTGDSVTLTRKKSEKADDEKPKK